MRVPSGARLYIEPNEFGIALSAAILKKQVPVMAVSDKDKADFVVQATSTAVSTLKWDLSSGIHVEAAATFANRDGAVVFACSGKGDMKGAAEDVAKSLKKHITGN